MTAPKTWADVRDLSHEERLSYVKTLPARDIFPTLEEWERDAKMELLSEVIDLFARGIGPEAKP